MAIRVVGNKDISVDYFTTPLLPAGKIDFSDVHFKNASGAGRSMIARSIKGAVGLR